MQPLEGEQLVTGIHHAGTRFVIAVTGGGSGAISSLLQVPGGSQSLLLATVPYCDTALVEWLGSRPDQFCSERTARAMAMVAYQKARVLDNTGARVAGIGCTASLASDRPKHGAHRFFIATQTAEATNSVSATLNKGERSRLDEEIVVARSILNEMAGAADLSTSLAIDWRPNEQPHRATCEAPVAWQDLLVGRLQRLQQSGPSTNPRVLFPGAFDPLHEGHRQMAQVASQLLNEPVAFEISVINVDKPPLDYLEMQRRSQQFSDADGLWFTRAPTFVEKASLFPGVTFVVGIDTMLRIAEPRYYANNFSTMLSAIECIAVAGCRFLVFGRQLDGKFQTLDDLNLPPSLMGLCQPVPEAAFRQDISSTDLRTQANR
jgi:cytidyltransferase-like protein